MVATLRKVNKNEWAVNDTPNQMFCMFCFFNADCNACNEIKSVNMLLTDNLQNNQFVINDLLKNLKLREERIEQTKKFLLDEVSIILDKREDNEKEDEKESTKPKTARGALRTRPIKSTKETDGKGKRKRKGKKKEDMAGYA